MTTAVAANTVVIDDDNAPAMLDRHPEQLANDPDRERERQQVYHVATTGVGELIEDLVDHRFDRREELVHLSRSELACHQAAHARVVRRFIHNIEYRGMIGISGSPRSAADPKIRCTSRSAELRIPQHLTAIDVAGETRNGNTAPR